MSNTYTKPEVDQMLQALRDELTVQPNDAFYFVNREAGGQTLEPTGVVGGESDDTVSYISVSYNSDDEEFTVSAKDLPFYIIGTSDTKFVDDPGLIQTFSSDDLAEDAEPLVFAAPPSSFRTISLSMESGYQHGFEYIWLMAWRGNITAASDYTNKVYNAGFDQVGVFQQIKLYADGSYELLLPHISPILATPGINTRQPMLYWYDGYLYLTDFVDQATGTIQTVALEAAGGTDDNVILGINNTAIGSRVVLDFSDNSGDYERFAVIGKIRVENRAGVDVATTCSLYMSQTPTLARSENVLINEVRQIDGGVWQYRDRTLTFQNGLYFLDTKGDWEDY